MEKTRPMSQMTLNEEKQELNYMLLDFLCKLEQLDAENIEILNIIPVFSGLKVVYKTSKNRVQKWARTIKYRALADWGLIQ